MRYTELKYGNKTYTIKSQIEKILENKNTTILAYYII